MTADIKSKDVRWREPFYGIGDYVTYYGGKPGRVIGVELIGPVRLGPDNVPTIYQRITVRYPDVDERDDDGALVLEREGSSSHFAACEQS